MKTIGTPNNIEVLLHFHCTPTRHPREDAGAVKEAIDLLCGESALIPDPEQGEGRYMTTCLGAAWVEALCRVEVPQIAYVDAAGNILKSTWRANHGN